MAVLSDYLEEKLINTIFRNTQYSTPGTIYLALYSVDPTDADTGTELVGDGYARQILTISAPVDGVSFNAADVIFDPSTADWASITHVGIRDALTAGNLLMHKVMVAPVDILSGSSFRIPAGSLEITFD